MKKNIITLLIVCFAVMPAFAMSRHGEKTEADIKVGVMINPAVKVDGSSTDMNMTFSLGTDFYYYPYRSFGFGLGANNIFGAKVKDSGSDAKYEFSNIYFAVKPKIVFDDYSVYYIGQLGYGMVRATDFEYDVENGLYWGLGVGVEYESFIFEILYSVNNSKIKTPTDSTDMQYSTLALNVGYRFHY